MHNPIDRIIHTTAYVTLVVEHWLEREKPITKDSANALMKLAGFSTSNKVEKHLFNESNKEQRSETTVADNKNNNDHSIVSINNKIGSSLIEYRWYVGLLTKRRDKLTDLAERLTKHYSLAPNITSRE